MRISENKIPEHETRVTATGLWGMFLVASCSCGWEGPSTYSGESTYGVQLSALIHEAEARRKIINQLPEQILAQKPGIALKIPFRSLEELDETVATLRKSRGIQTSRVGKTVYAWHD